MYKYRKAHWRAGWSPVEVIARFNGWEIELAYNSDDEFPYCVQSGGAGHYFKTRFEARAYCHGRGWINSREIYKEGAQ